MKKNNTIFYSLLIFIIAAFSACGADNNANVEKAIKGFFEGMYDRDFVKAREHATPESEEVIAMLESFAQHSDPDPDEKPVISIADVVITDDTLATANVKASGQPNEVKLSLKKRDGKWLVAFDPRSLATMLGQNPETVDEDMMAPPDDSLDLRIDKSTVPLDPMVTDSVL